MEITVFFENFLVDKTMYKRRLFVLVSKFGKTLFFENFLVDKTMYKRRLFVLVSNFGRKDNITNE
jgi:hypothetical protein